MHGPSVFPPQPDGIWNMPYNEDRWVESEGEDRYRRSLYTFLRRTSPYPMHMTFDATSREYCAVRRVRTNTPLQALTLLNDRASFEAARALAARVAGVRGCRRRRGDARLPAASSRAIRSRPSSPGSSPTSTPSAASSRGSPTPPAQGRAGAGGGPVRGRRRGAGRSPPTCCSTSTKRSRRTRGVAVSMPMPNARLRRLHAITRRFFFEQADFGLGGLALASLLDPAVASAAQSRATPESSGGRRARRTCTTPPRRSASSTCSWPARRRSSICSIRSRR